MSPTDPSRMNTWPVSSLFSPEGSSSSMHA
jgi:hypothetical protein